MSDNSRETLDNFYRLFPKLKDYKQASRELSYATHFALPYNFDSIVERILQKGLDVDPALLSRMRLYYAKEKVRMAREQLTKAQAELYKLEEEQTKETPTPPDTKPWSNYICNEGCCHMTEHQHEFSLDPPCGGRWVTILERP